MADFLLELLSEEIPARMQDEARANLAKLFTAELSKAGLVAGELVTYATPRRLTLIAHGLPLAIEAVSEEIKGPKVGAPPQALDGFLRKVGLSEDQLVARDGVYFAVVEQAGRATADVLAAAIPEIIRAFPWPKSQRWGAASRSTESLRWVRPLQAIVALLGDAVVPCEIAGIVSGRTTAGHRFHHRGPVTISSVASYAEELRAAKVIVDQAERRALIQAGAAQAAADAKLVLVDDAGLVNENAGLTEWPVPLLGRFDPAFLEVPEEVIQLTARVNQKYFICRKIGGKLAPAFVCTANILANDGGAAIIAGNEKVLAARLSDAKFFWQQDLKIPLEQQAKKLAQITFHEKLGTVADKVERVAMLARWLCEAGIVNGDADLAERAALLCKADLVSGMVGEFPELQGIMGGYYATAQGEHSAVAAAIREHYKPVGQGDAVPTDPVTVAVSLADKLDTLLGFFCIDERPTGSRDPFALRRAALGLAATILEKGWRIPLRTVCRNAPILQPDTDAFAIFEKMYVHGFGTSLSSEESAQIDRSKLNELADEVVGFIIDRLKVQQREAGVRHDLIDAVFALGGEDDLVRLLARVKALQIFVDTAEGKDLLAGYKRAANILKSAPTPLEMGFN
jgi:glycyl-tRNA synthetase beta chain